MASSAAGKTRFFADGYIVVRNLIFQDELQTLRWHYENLVLGRVADFPQYYISIRDVESRANFGLARTESEPELPVPQGSAHDGAILTFIPRAKKPSPHSAASRFQTRLMP